MPSGSVGVTLPEKRLRQRAVIPASSHGSANAGCEFVDPPFGIVVCEDMAMGIESEPICDLRVFPEESDRVSEVRHVAVAAYATAVPSEKAVRVDL